MHTREFPRARRALVAPAGSALFSRDESSGGRTTTAVIYVDASQAEAAFKEAIKVLGERVPEVKMLIARRLGLEIANEANRLAPVDRGELRASIKVREELGAVVVEADGGHASFVEFGTRPHTPPFRAIERWAYRHGIEPGAVWTSIQRKGTKRHPFMRLAAEAGLRHADRILKEVVEAELKEIAAEIERKAARASARAAPSDPTGGGGSGGSQGGQG